MNYNVDYFIKKFEAIPEEKWGMGMVKRKNGLRCAIGFCGAGNDEDNLNQIARALGTILKPLHNIPISEREAIFMINDRGYKSHNYTSLETPKQRILAALYDIKASEDAVKQTQEILNTKTQLQKI